MMHIYIQRERDKNREGGRQRTWRQNEKAREREQNGMEIDSENQACYVHLKGRTSFSSQHDVASGSSCQNQ